MREIVLDTETTGLNYKGDDRIVEIGCIELVNHVATGRTYQTYINPERDIPSDAFRVHGLSREFLSQHPAFAGIFEDFLGFLADSPLIIHNAEFDMGFLNAELERLNQPSLTMDRATDTVRLARRKFPGAQASLDALCRRFQIDLSERGLHGALKDARLLAEVYLELVGGRQPGLELSKASRQASVETGQEATIRAPRPHAPSAEEEAAHGRFIKALDSPIWNA